MVLEALENIIITPIGYEEISKKTLWSAKCTFEVSTEES